MENGQPIQISETAPKGGGTGRDTNAPVIAPPTKAKVLFQKVFGSPTDDSLTKSVRRSFLIYGIVIGLGVYYMVKKNKK